MLAIRLSRVGKKKAPVYRIVVMPKHRDPWAKTIEILGHYNPIKNPKELVVKGERVQHWIKMGAELSDTLHNLFVENKIIEGKKITSSHLSKKRTKKIEKTATDAKAKVDAAKAKAEAAKLAEETAKKAAADAAKAEAETAKEAAKAAAAAQAEAPAEAPAEVVAETPAE